MHRALYRTWRPRTFDEVCGQDHVTDILKYQVSEGKVSHAYLFYGSRGTGKTSCAKILAKAVNCLHPVRGNPCNECEACRAIDAGTATDVIEMDAASNNGVDNVRDLKEEIIYMPAELKYRVYIIDEVHMMSPSAFNALLKTLEEPPAHVLFILATTELGKLPPTIVSRCQRCDFRRIGTEVIMARLAKIAEAEKMTLTQDGARMIARASQGGMRDAVSLLELCAGAHADINEELVSSLLGAGNRGELAATLEAVFRKDYAALFRAVDETVMSSGDLGGFFSGLADMVRNLIVVKTVPDAKSYLDLTDSEEEKLRKMAESVSLDRLLYISREIENLQPSLQKTGIARRAAAEITLTRMCDPRLGTTPEAMVSRIEELEREVAILRMGISPSPSKTAQTPNASTAPSATPAAAPVEQANRTETIAPTSAQAEEPVIPAEKKASPAAPENKGDGAPAVSDETQAAWQTIQEEFLRLFPYYRGVFAGVRMRVSGDVLTLYLRPHVLVSNFQADTRARQAILKIAGETMKTALTRLDTEVPKSSSDAPKIQDENLY